MVEATISDAVGDDPSSRRFTRAFLAVLLAGMAATATLAIFVDPLHVFGTGRIPSIRTGERDEKPASFLALEPAPQAIVLGTSRVMKLAPSCLREVTGFPAFNFGLSSSFVEDWLAVYRFVRVRGRAPLRVLVIGVDIEAFDNHAETDPRLPSSPYLRDYVEGSAGLTWGAASRALFGWQALRYGLRSLQYHLRPQSKPKLASHFDPDGLIRYDVWEDELRRGTFTLAPQLADLVERFKGPLAAPSFTALSAERVELFLRLVRSAHAAGTTVVAYVPPIHAKLAALRRGAVVQRMRELDQLLAGLERDGQLRYFRVDKIEDVGGDPEGYFDGVHVRDANAARLVTAMFGRQHGCGI